MLGRGEAPTCVLHSRASSIHIPNQGMQLWAVTLNGLVVCIHHGLCKELKGLVSRGFARLQVELDLCPDADAALRWCLGSRPGRLRRADADWWTGRIRGRRRGRWRRYRGSGSSTRRASSCSGLSGGAATLGCPTAVWARAEPPRGGVEVVLVIGRACCTGICFPLEAGGVVCRLCWKTNSH